MASISSILKTDIEDQAAREIENSVVYTQLALFADYMKYSGFAKWLHKQAADEMGHANKFLSYLISRNCNKPPKFSSIVAPKVAYPEVSLQAVFELAFNRELVTTGHIEDLYSAAQSAKDYMTVEFLHWFLKEQVEEEEKTAEILAKIKSAGTDYAALLLLDKEYGEQA